MHTKKLFGITAISTVLGLYGIAAAQQPPQAAQQPQSQQQSQAQQQQQAGQQNGDRPPVIVMRDWNYDTIYGRGWSARNLMDEAEVYGPGGEEIGSVENLVIGRDGKLVGIIAQVGGFLDIGDTHVFVPWDEVQVRSDLSRVTIPVTEETVDDYSTWADAYLRKAETSGSRILESDLATGPRIWKATELLGDDSFLNGKEGYGNISDLIFTTDGNLHAVVVTSYAGYGGGYRAFPYYGYGYGWEPGYPAYYLGYGRHDVQNMEQFDYNRMNGRVAMENRATTTGQGGDGSKQEPANRRAPPKSKANQ